MEWGRWLGGEGRRPEGSLGPASAVRREPGLELGGPLVPGEDPEGTQGYEGRRAQRGNLRPWGQAGSSLKGRRTTAPLSLVFKMPPRQTRPLPWPPPLRGTQGRRAEDVWGDRGLRAGSRRRASGGTTGEVRGGERRTSRDYWEEDVCQDCPCPGALGGPLAAGGRVPLLSDGMKRVWRGTYRRGAWARLDPPEGRGKSQESPRELRQYDRGQAGGKRPEAGPRCCLEVTRLEAGTKGRWAACVQAGLGGVVD